MLPVEPPLQAGFVVVLVRVMGAIVKLKHAGGATLPQRSVTEPTAVPRQKENVPPVRMAGEIVTVTVLP
jgi:hypothetical protein